jgi:two-component sensor histidine kinase
MTRIIEGLEKTRFLLERAEEMANIGSWEFDYPTGKVTASLGACRIYGVEEGTLTVEDIQRIPLERYRPALDRARENLIARDVPYDVEFEIERSRDGAIRRIHSKARWDPESRRLFGIIRDITEEIETATGLKRAIAERETLIKELYHRTKNNMQVITSLLGIEAARSSEPRVQTVFKEVQRRIDTMALVHEMLYRSKDLSRIDLEDFVPALAKLLASSFGDRDGRIALDYAVEKVELLIDAAVPCGIILNELIGNAYCHAFPGERAGTIRITASRESDGTVAIGVFDDGAGVPEGFDPLKGGDHLGLMLVSSIGRSQLSGTVDFLTSEGGFGCVLRFKDSGFKARV